ncbi:AMP-binding protein [bacterium]|nr:AMP-binding protein [bacterium]
MTIFLKQLYDNLDIFGDNIAFCIDDTHYTYAELAKRIAVIQKNIQNWQNHQYFGIVTRNSIDTYATIFALWLSGKTSVPINTKNPQDRNQYIINNVGIAIVFDAEVGSTTFNSCKTICTATITNSLETVKYVEVNEDTDLYILFTSGSTGKPKGVRINQKNIDSYISELDSLNYRFDHDDRCLLVAELTFDASVQCYLYPLLKGASVYTLPNDGIRFLMMLKILQTQDISFVKMTPSAIFYLQNYFDQIHLPKVKYSLFGAEALSANLVAKWSKCVPNAEIQNVYGPTEATVNCSMYRWNESSGIKSLNGIISIGKMYDNIKSIVCDDQLNIVEDGLVGELCLSGNQLSQGYWKRPENNVKSFFTKNIDNKDIRFYRTGDLVKRDEEGDFFYIGRMDNQVQVDGFRVELGEIENLANHNTESRCIALVKKMADSSKMIILFVESLEISEHELYALLIEKLPDYMIPKQIKLVSDFPLLVSGKVDNQQLLQMI